MTAREWLEHHGYPDVVELIDAVMARWAQSGLRTRRNWWEVLAGDRNGRTKVIAGIQFPVLAVAQRHEGVPVTTNAIRRGARELPQRLARPSTVLLLAVIWLSETRLRFSLGSGQAPQH
jgi:hypothetical protein